MSVSKKHRVFSDFVRGFYAPLEKELDDDSISEILINGHDEIFVERKGRLERCDSTFPSEATLLAALRSTAQFLGRPLDDAHPILEGRLPDGSRLEAVLPPLSDKGPCVAIRKHQTETLSFEQLLEWGALDETALALLRRCADEKRNVLVSGGTGSGKTSLLRLIASLIPEHERIVTLEDARELHLTQPHVVALETRPPNEKGQGKVDIAALFHATLRLRPDRIVVGELRGGEALDLIQAMTSGHGGCLSTVHASSPLDALRRLETLSLYRGLDLPLAALRAQVASAVDVIVQVQRYSDGSRKVSSIGRVQALDEKGGYRVRPLLQRDSSGSPLRKPHASVSPAPISGTTTRPRAPAGAGA